MKKGTFFAFLAPSLLVILLTQFYPLSVALYMSLTRWNMMENAGTFAGFANYSQVLSQSGFWDAMLYTVALTVIAVWLELVFGFTLALLIDAHIRRVAAINTMLLIPMIISPVVVGLMFKWLFNPTFGLVGYMLSLFGIPAKAWLSDPVLASAAIIIAEVWQFTPFMVLIAYAGLQSMPIEPVEAARVDGANWFDVVRHITIPTLKPLLAFAVVIRSIDTFRLFDKVYIMTGGGPGYATETFSLFNYRVAFQNLRMGEGAAVAVMTLAVLAVIILWFLRLVSPKGGVGLA